MSGTPEPAAYASARPAIRIRWAPVLVFAVVLAAFAPICRHEFVAWDDDRTIQHNPRIQSPSFGNAAYYWLHQHLGLYIPVTYSVWSAVASLAQVRDPDVDPGTLDPRFFHAASVAIHGIGALLVFAILQRLMRRPWAAAGGALLFALHPIQVEAVAWTSGLKDVLAGAFTFLSLWQYLLACAPVKTRTTQSRRTASHYALALVAMLLGMLSKPAAVVTPLLLVIIDRLILQRPWRRVVASTAPFLVLAIPCVVWTQICQPPTNLVHTPLWARPLIAIDALTFYLAKLLMPIHLGLDYGRNPATVLAGRWIWWFCPLAAAWPIAAGLVYRRHPAARTIAASTLLFAAALLPVLGFTPFAFQSVSTVTDHYVYVAMLGPALLTAWMLTNLQDRSQFNVLTVRRWSIAVAAIVLGALATATTVQARHWQDTRSLLSHALDVNPNSWPACTNLASLEYDEGRDLDTMAAVCEISARRDDAAAARVQSEQRLRDAEALFTRALEIYPDNIAARHTRGVLRMHFHRPAEAVADFQQAIVLRQRLAPDDQPAFFQDDDLLGLVLLDAHRPAEAASAFRRALALHPPPPQTAEHLRMADLRQHEQ